MLEKALWHHKNTYGISTGITGNFGKPAYIGKIGWKTETGLMVRLLVLGTGLFVLWLLLSGLFKPLLIGLGILSCLVTLAISQRMGIHKRPDDTQHHSLFGFVFYLGWLAIEIAKSNWAVTKVILSSKLSIKQSLFNVPVSQSSDLGKVLFANSITLTPGTITVETEEGYFLTHALTKAAADLDALADMNRRVAAIERKDGGL